MRRRVLHAESSTATGEGSTRMLTTGTRIAVPPPEQGRFARAGMRPGWLARLGAVVVGSVLMAAAFPPTAWWWTAPIGIALVSTGSLGSSLGHAAGVGMAGGAVFAGMTLWWIKSSVGTDAWLGLIILFAMWWAITTVAAALVQRREAWPLLVPAVWVLQETLRSSVPWGGFPWARLGFTVVDSPLLPLSAVVGVGGVTYLVALIGCVGAAAAVALRRGDPRRAVVWVLSAAALIGTGGLVLTVPATGSSGREPTVTMLAAVVQGGPVASADRLSQMRAVLRSHVTQTVRLARASGVRPRVVVWPESSTDIDPLTDASAARLLDSATDTVGAPIVVGAVTSAPGGRLRNQSIVWAPGRGAGESYVKQRLVPFGEYVPGREWMGPLAGRFAQIPRDFIAGDVAGVIDVAGTRLGVLICYEVAFDDVARSTIAAGAQVLAVPTNNATYSGTAQPAQQLAMSQFRAVELDRAVLVAATTGVSAIIRQDGTVLASLGDAASGALTAQVELRDSVTPAARWGGQLTLAMALLAALSVFWEIASPIRRRWSPRLG